MDKLPVSTLCHVFHTLITHFVWVFIIYYTEIDYTAFSTRHHSSRMHTARLETVCASKSVATNRCHGGWGWWLGLQINKFEQVSSDHHQMSLTWGRSPGLISRRGVPYHVIYPMMHLMLPTLLWTDRWLWKLFLSAAGRNKNTFLSGFAEVWMRGMPCHYFGHPSFSQLTQSYQCCQCWFKGFYSIDKISFSVSGLNLMITGSGIWCSPYSC